MTTGRKKADRAAEIEVTPEMIEAGVNAYLDHEDMFEPREVIVTHIYTAMRLAKIDGPEAAARYLESSSIG